MIIYKNSYSLTKKNKLQYWFLFRYKENNILFRDGNRHFFMQSNHDYILSYLKRCICCWYWVRVLPCRILLSYKMFGTNILPSCDFYHSKKFTTTCPNPTLTFFQVSLWFGKQDPKNTFHVFTIWISTIAIACSVGTVSCSAVGFLFFSDKVLFFTRFCIIGQWNM